MATAGLVYPVGSTRWAIARFAKPWNPLPPHGYRVCSALARGGAWRTARTPGPCEGCGDWLDVGDIFLDTGARRGREMATYRLCITCAYKGAYQSV